MAPRAVKTGGCAPGVAGSESRAMPMASSLSPKSSGTCVERQPVPVEQLSGFPAVSVAVM